MLGFTGAGAFTGAFGAGVFTTGAFTVGAFTGTLGAGALGLAVVTFFTTPPRPLPIAFPAPLAPGTFIAIMLLHIF
jgi:hypothetical protein